MPGWLVIAGEGKRRQLHAAVVGDELELGGYRSVAIQRAGAGLAWRELVQELVEAGDPPPQEIDRRLVHERNRAVRVRDQDPVPDGGDDRLQLGADGSFGPARVACPVAGRFDPPPRPIERLHDPGPHQTCHCEQEQAEVVLWRCELVPAQGAGEQDDQQQGRDQPGPDSAGPGQDDDHGHGDEEPQVPPDYHVCESS